ATVSGVRAEQSALSGCTAQPCQGAPLPGFNTLRDDPSVGVGDSFKRSTGLNAQKRGGKPRKASAENIFLLDVAAMCERWKKGSGKGELSGSGAWWRLAFRADPELMGRVLADTLCAVKEGRIKTTPGQMAADT